METWSHCHGTPHTLRNQRSPMNRPEATVAAATSAPWEKPPTASMGECSSSASSTWLRLASRASRCALPPQL